MTTSPTPDTSAPGSSDDHPLRVEAQRAKRQADELEAEYESLLADSDTIQEDRDAARQMLEEARAVARTAAKAVDRLDAGEYGTCTKCGDTISPERLEAIPDVETCVACSR